MSEPTSTLTFNDLILEVAEKLGIAYYGSAGTSAASIPVNAQDLALCKKTVNNAIRMFINDAPQPNGWRFLRPVASLATWADIDQDSTNKISTATFNAAGSNTTLVIPTAAFQPSMELKTLSIETEGDVTIESYVSSTSVLVSGSHTGAADKKWSIESGGNFTLPSTFGGQYAGEVTYADNSNRGVEPEWSDESTIRQWRANVMVETGFPYLFAVRVMDTGTPRRRWELMAYPKPDENTTVEFPYVLHFDSLVNLTEVHPAPFGHDEAIKAACRAAVEKDVERALGVEWSYYREIALPNSYRVDAMSAPKKLQPRGARFGSIREFRAYGYQRPNVTFNP
jgi:hypothetical protein